MDATQPLTQSFQSSSTTSPEPIPAEDDKTVINSDYDTFLAMLTAQAENQDPLDPMDSTDYATQLATFSGVEQQVLTNDLLKEMNTNMDSMGMAQLSGWVGMEGRAEVSAAYDGDPITIDPQPRNTADTAYLIVRDPNGTEVQRQQIDLTGGAMEWDGIGADGEPLPHQNYSFEVENHAAGEVIGRDPVAVYSEIQEAQTQDGETILIFESGERLHSDAVTAVREAR